MKQIVLYGLFITLLSHGCYPPPVKTYSQLSTEKQYDLVTKKKSKYKKISIDSYNDEEIRFRKNGDSTLYQINIADIKYLSPAARNVHHVLTAIVGSAVVFGVILIVTGFALDYW